MVHGALVSRILDTYLRYPARERSGLTLQMGGGQTADLEFHGGDAFFTRWRDPLFREYYGTHVQFPAEGGSVRTLRTRINRDEFSAEKRE